MMMTEDEMWARERLKEEEIFQLGEDREEEIYAIMSWINFPAFIFIVNIDNRLAAGQHNLYEGERIYMH